MSECVCLSWLERHSKSKRERGGAALSLSRFLASPFSLLVLSLLELELEPFLEALTQALSSRLSQKPDSRPETRDFGFVPSRV